MMPGGLYAVTPDGIDTDALVAKVRAALAGGAAAVQYRSKSGDAGLRRAQVDALLALTRPRRVPLIVNDDVALAAAAGADGVHLGRDDAGIDEARRRLPGAIVGASCYASLERAREAAARGAGYLAFGSVFASPTKPAAVRAPLALFGQARALGLPLIAIGGITAANAAEVRDAGADGVAVISDLFDAADVRGRAEEFARLFAGAREASR
jgi:thiamine-phosphate pyrophosphorylase